MPISVSMSRVQLIVREHDLGYSLQLMIYLYIARRVMLFRSSRYHRQWYATLEVLSLLCQPAL